MLNSLQDVAKDGTTFAQLLSANNQQFEDILSGINNGSIEYPSLIYDGPFSDGVIQREAKGVTGEEISADQGKVWWKNILLAMILKT